jgi:hypothetical protein
MSFQHERETSTPQPASETDCLPYTASPEIIGVIMDTRFHEMKLCSGAAPKTREEMYPFTPGDVAEVYFHKNGHGAGIWFRLNDARVFDAYGKPSESEFHHYVRRV